MPAPQGVTRDAEGLTLEYTSEGTCTAVIVVVGPRGGGKTTLMAALTPLLAPNDRASLISPVRRIGGILGLPVNVRYGSDKSNEQFFGAFLNGRHQVLVIDEFDEYCSGGVQGKFGGYCCDALYRIVNYARNEPWCVGMLVSFRGASDVTTNLLRAANVLFVAQTSEPNALDYFGRFFGREYVDALRKLPKYVFAVFQDGRLKGFVKTERGQVEWIQPPEGWPKGQINASSAEPSIPPESTNPDPTMSVESARDASAPSSPNTACGEP